MKRRKLLDETDSSLTALVEARTAARNTARDAHNKALAAFNAASGGPIYQAAVAEWNAKAAVTQSIADYNEQVTKTNTARTCPERHAVFGTTPVLETERRAVLSR